MKSTGPTSPSNPPFLSGNQRAAHSASVGCVSAQGSGTWCGGFLLSVSPPLLPFLPQKSALDFLQIPARKSFPRAISFPHGSGMCRAGDTSFPRWLPGTQGDRRGLLGDALNA